MSKLFLKEFFNQLQVFKRYPKYQYERRIDGFIGFFLPAVLKSHQINATKIIPEFPVKAHLKYRRSYNIDYLLYDSSRNCITFVELKTDSVSVSEKQLKYYIETMNTPWRDLKGHVKWISEKSVHKDKYKFLLEKIEDIPEDVKMEAIFLAPAEAFPIFKSNFQSVASQIVGIEFKKEWKRWRFLSLEKFATSEEVQTKYQTEWQELADALKAI